MFTNERLITGSSFMPVKQIPVFSLCLTSNGNTCTYRSVEDNDSL